jgi:probable O-glycosylation ligase (exosortase A-associated)
MLRTIFVLSILLPGLVASLFSDYIALLLYLWFAMFRPTAWMWIDISAYQPSLVIGIILLVSEALRGQFPAVFNALGLASVAFLAIAALAQFDAVAPDVGLQWLDYLTRLIVVSLLIPPICNTIDRLWGAVAVMSASFLFHGAKAGLASILGGGVRFYDGLAGAFVDNNGYALGTAMALFLFLGVALATRRKALGTVAAAAATPLAIMGIASLFSRAGFVALASGGACFLLLLGRFRNIAIAMAFVAAIVSILPEPKGGNPETGQTQTYTERLAFATDSSVIQEDASIASRFHFWRVAADMAASRAFGVGLWNYGYAYDLFDSSDGAHGSGRAVHSSYFQVLAETGYLGFGLYLLLLGGSALQLLAVRRQSHSANGASVDAERLAMLATGTLASLVAFGTGGATLSLALNDITWFSFGIVIALGRLSAGMAQQEAPLALASASATA